MPSSRSPGLPPDLSVLVDPRSVAIVGASSQTSRLAGRPLEVLLRSGYSGRIFPVNPRHQEIGGIKSFAGLRSLPEVPDVALCVVRAELVPDVATDAAALGVPYLVVFSSGFNEIAEGKALLGRLEQAVRGSVTRVLGPNTEGLFDLRSQVPLTFSPVVDPSRRSKPLKPGSAVVISQSGGMGFAMADSLAACGTGVRAVVTTGNEVDLEVCDFLDFYATDQSVAAMLIFVEGFRSSERFLRTASQVVNHGIAVIACGVGQSEPGRSAAASHTGKLVGGRQAQEALFAKAGVLPAATLEEAVDGVVALISKPPGSGRRVGIITVSGGGGVWMADRLPGVGLTLPQLSDDLQARLRSFLPPYASVRNPVDVTAQAAFDVSLAPAVSILMESEELDALVVVATFGYDHRIRTDPLVKRALMERTKPVVVFSYTQPSEESIAFLAECGVPWFTDPARASAGLALMLQPPKSYPYEHIETKEQGDPRQVLAIHGVRFNAIEIVTDAKAAGRAADRLGYPAVMKGIFEQPVHKHELGAVIVGIRDRAEAEARFAELGDVASIEPQLVGHEVIFGAVNDPQVGAVVMVGPGGFLVDTFVDKLHRLAPLRVDEATATIEALRGYPAWRYGYRDLPPANIESLTEQLVAFSRGVAALDPSSWLSVECNPVIAGPQAAIAVDFRFIGTEQG